MGAAWPAQDPRREVSGKVTEDQTGPQAATEELRPPEQCPSNRTILSRSVA